MGSISYLVMNTSIGIMYVTSCQCTNRQRCIFNWTTRLQRLLCASQKTTSIFCGHGTKNLCSTGAQISLTSTCHLCSFPYHLSLSPLPPSPKTHTQPLTNPVQEHDVQNVNCKRTPTGKIPLQPARKCTNAKAHELVGYRLPCCHQGYATEVPKRSNKGVFPAI